MKDLIIYNAFATVIASMNSCKTGGCDRFNMFHVGLLSDVQANNMNSEVFASYEFNRLKNETKTGGYQAPLLILEPTSEVITPDSGNFSDFDVVKGITLYAGDVYNKGCCGIGNECTERSKMQILQDLKNMLIGVVQEVMDYLESQDIFITIEKIELLEDISFSFGNVGMGGVKAELEIFYSSCAAVCGFDYDVEPNCENDLAMTFEVEEIAAPTCFEGEALYQYFMQSGFDTPLNLNMELLSVTHHWNEYVCPSPILLSDTLALNAFLQSLYLNETIVATPDNGQTPIYFKLVAQCCAELIVDNQGHLDGWSFKVNDNGTERTIRFLEIYSQQPCANIQQEILTFECCRKYLVTATPTGTAENIISDVIKWHVPENAAGVENNSVETLANVVFSRTTKYGTNGMCISTIYYLVSVVDGVTTVQQIDDLIWQ